MIHRVFTTEELRRYDGADGRPAYVAYKGIVYDVSTSFLWKQGRHQALHQAGFDHTTSFAEAPHDPDLLDRFPVVGVTDDYQDFTAIAGDR